MHADLVAHLLVPAADMPACCCTCVCVYVQAAGVHGLQQGLPPDKHGSDMGQQDMNGHGGSMQQAQQYDTATQQIIVSVLGWCCSRWHGLTRAAGAEYRAVDVGIPLPSPFDALSLLGALSHSDAPAWLLDVPCTDAACRFCRRLTCEPLASRRRTLSPPCGTSPPSTR